MSFPTVPELHQHIATHTPQTAFRRETALDEATTTYTHDYLPPFPSLENTLGVDRPAIHSILAYEAAAKRYAKVSMVVMCEYVHMDENGVIDRSITAYHWSKTYVISLYRDYWHILNRCHAEIAVCSQDFVTKGSDWILQR
jgi:hypothetical protein